MIQPRQPVVAVLGHVDHGKTTLLDAVRKSNVASREAGGITQGIGASVVETKEGKKITFIDTPGHAAFSGMRSRGAKAADIAILVVAADDGAKPQTREAIQIILEAKIPFIVAFTKIDLPSANIEAAKASIEKEGVYLEGRGGDIPFAEVSAKEGKGVEELLNLIILVSEVHDILADPEGELEAVIIETGKDNRGTLATAVVKNGTIAVGDQIISDELEAKVRGLFDFRNKATKSGLPGDPVLILGFSQVPKIGSLIKKGGKGKSQFEEEKVLVKGEVKEGQIPVVLKAQNAGSLEALVASMPPEVFVASASVGEVNESDLFVAKTTGPAKILSFESRVSGPIAKLAETEGVEIYTFRIIYELLDKVQEMVKAQTKEILSKAEIIAKFPFNNKQVAGLRLVTGRIAKGDKLILLRGEEELGEVRASSLRRGKDEMKEVTEGEFGLIFEPQLDFQVGDVLISRA